MLAQECDPGQTGGAVATVRFEHHRGTALASHLGGAVGRAIVHDDDDAKNKARAVLAGVSAPRRCTSRDGREHVRKRLLLVESRDQNRNRRSDGSSTYR